LIGIGYEGLTLDAFIDRLQRAQVTMLVDVRLNAISRKAGFSKRALQDALGAAGIEYRHDRRLGNPKDNRAGYREVGTSVAIAARDRFRDMLRAEVAEAAINELRDLATSRSIAVLCFEADGRHCHREQVIDAVTRSTGSPLVVE